MIIQKLTSILIFSFITFCCIGHVIYADTTSKALTTATVVPPSSSQAATCPCDFNVNEITAIASKINSLVATCRVYNTSDNFNFKGTDMMLHMSDMGSGNREIDIKQRIEQSINWSLEHESGKPAVCSKKLAITHLGASSDIIINGDAQYQACVRDFMKAAAAVGLTCKP